VTLPRAGIHDGTAARRLPEVATILVTAILIGVASWILIRTAQTYLPFFADDALITLRYSDRLLAGQGLTFNDNDYVEGYSNLLWLLAVAAGGLLHRDLIDVARVLGTASVVAAFGAVAYASGLASWSAVWGGVAGVAILALSHGMAIWSIGGLEQPLQAVLLAWALALTVVPRAGTGVTVAGGLLALLALTRPDGILFTAAVTVGLVVADGMSTTSLRLAARLVVLPGLAWIAQHVFRLWYYGDWLPNTAFVKLSGSLHHLLYGMGYVSDAVLHNLPVVLLGAGVVATVRPFRQRVTLVPLGVIAAWASYVAWIGGDIFPGRRHFLPVLVCLAVGAGAAWRQSALARLPLPLQGLVVFASVLPFAVLQARDSANTVAREEVWEWECATVARTLRAAFEPAAPLVAADPVGCMGYFSALPTLDMLGLTDRHIARTRPPDFGQGWIGHELGDGRYVLAREPDLVVLCTPRGSATGCFRSGVELVALPEFQHRYLLTTIVAPDGLYTSRVWVRRDSPAVGLRRAAAPERLHVPGLLFATDAQAQARPAPKTLVARLDAGRTVRFTGLPPEVTGWHPVPVASAPVDVAVDGSSVLVTAGPEGADLHEVVFTKPPA
jgi:hypothetical protein